MANVDYRRGLEPHGPLLRTRRYPITASYGTALFIGDPVVGVAGGTIEIATAGTGNEILGAILGIFKDGGRMTTRHYVASSTDSYYALVANHPDQEFVCQDDGDTTAIALADRHNSANLVATAAGDETRGLSGWEINGSDAVGGFAAGDQVRVIDLLSRADNALGAHADWIVQIQNHQLAQASVGVGV